MSTAAEKIKANAERLRQKPPTGKPAGDPSVPTEPQTPAPQPAPVAPAKQPIVRQKTVRRTVDLSPTAHRALDNWQRDAADRLGLARVTGQEVLAALVDRLLADPELGDRITEAISSHQ
ncbi:hypothetical protein MTY66_63640 (plasmid) [Mycolicibacterium sp. TY66]|uniref:hypothetical protein n=1 Tax=Mycobacteriaceae TaxID=1762 RepID=UPI000C25A950|nr:MULTISPECIES: hypothetical protein [Mycobacteriaceae]RIT73901.1 hypothetical protein D2E82_23340 [Mycobacteroides abscessus]BCI84739.1 hypothetical protein MTY66_63640 [Mycolicibacterium sp. TY66]BCJ84988.1 hypothetical protein MTY81_63610 [Mycolicibacterium sp. TY81]